MHHPVTTILGQLAFFLIMFAGTMAFYFAIVMRFRQVTLGKRVEVRWDEIPTRIKNVLVFVLGQKRLPANGYWYSGLLHIMIFGTFVVLSIDTINFILEGTVGLLYDYKVTKPFALWGIHGPYQGLADTFRFLCIVGLGMALVNRTIIKPKRLPLTRDALYTLAFIFGLMVFEVLQGAFYIALTKESGYTWFSALIAKSLGGLSQETLVLGYQGAWWAHLINLLAFTNYVPWSKHSHVFAAPLNIFFMSLEPKGALRKMEIDPEAEDVTYFGARSLEDLSWKQIFDGLSCTECGRCTDNCPASRSDKPLRPMDIIVGLKHHAEDRYKAIDEIKDIEGDARAHLVPTVFHPDVLWSCTTCRACMEVCPVGNEHVPAIVDMRRYLTMTLGEVGHGAGGTLKNIDRKANPWGMSAKDREQWTEGLDFEVPRANKKNPTEYLLWVGCAGAFDDNGKKVSRATARLLHKAGVDFSILGKNEKCTGDSARRLGDEYLFQQMAEDNVGTFAKFGVRKIITTCPHCLNTLDNEYPQFGGEYEVIHHTAFLAQLLEEGRLKLKEEDPNGAHGRVVYHDSCYLGRYNDIYEPQRALLDAMPDLDRVETARTRSQGLCCGAGGGHMWMEMNLGDRVNYQRTDELLETQADTIAVACNFCMTMIDDGVKARSKEDEVKVIDIAELLDSRVE
ncbi:(Fe-S)-binding protein [Myxococcota bacterium]|nr:(Fe-S)-binding protein [Myxococcota bacterium]MBU1431191.1 (Fe-S)-binding protein [Myxococcota bacterium]MBU1897876.1 (Fe-S)-binding protein [Myxococcota bacterium]